MLLGGLCNGRRGYPDGHMFVLGRHAREESYIRQIIQPIGWTFPVSSISTPARPGSVHDFVDDHVWAVVIAVGVFLSRKHPFYLQRSMCSGLAWQSSDSVPGEEEARAYLFWPSLQ